MSIGRYSSSTASARSYSSAPSTSGACFSIAKILLMVHMSALSTEVLRIMKETATTLVSTGRRQSLEIVQRQLSGALFSDLPSRSKIPADGGCEIEIPGGTKHKERHDEMAWC